MPAPTDAFYVLAGDGHRWGAENGLPLGGPVTITYSYSTSAPPNLQADFPGFTPFNATQIAATEAALDYIESFTNLTFVEVSGNNGDLQFSNADLQAYGAGGVAPHAVFGNGGIDWAHVLMNNGGPTRLDNQAYIPGEISIADRGGSAWQTLLHEIGHAIGLKHPHEANAAGDPNSIMPSAIDNLTFSTMSYVSYPNSTVAVRELRQDNTYNVHPGILKPTTFSIADIAALQYLYGVDTSSTGNKTFKFMPDKPVYMTISDNGPNNTVDVSALTGVNTIYLAPGSFSDLAIQQNLPAGTIPSGAYDGTRALAIAHGVFVANVIGGSGVDRIAGNDVANRLFGRNGDDDLRGGGAADYLDGGLGADHLEGESGNDFLRGGANDDDLFGGNDNDRLEGGAGADHLDGGMGTDAADYRMAGPGLVVDLATPANSTNEAAGDTYTSIERFLLSNHADVFVGADDKNDHVLGYDGDDQLSGMGGNDFLDGLTGADTMEGGLGNDTYVVDNAGDVVIEVDGEGTDRVIARANYTLAEGTSIEMLLAAASTGITLTGNSNHDRIAGAAGGDTLKGLAGNDVLNGRDGADILIGESGRDMLYGGLGADTFLFEAASESPHGGHDTIRDFSRAQGDHIDIGALAASLTFIGHAAFSGAIGEVRTVAVTGGEVVYVNLDADLASEFTLRVFTATALVETDFLL